MCLFLAFLAGPGDTEPVPVAAVAVPGQADLRFLNHRPAGMHGPVAARGEALAFADGTPAVFWGINLQAYALFATKPTDVPSQARRLAQLGFNLVRIHHHDAAWVRPNIFGDKRFGTSTPDPEAMARLDWWIKCLRDEGIYVWLDLHVGRVLTEADGVADFAETVKDGGRGRIKGFNYVNDDVRARMAEFNAAYLGHVNPYTGLDYAHDPAIAAVLVTNENDLTTHFGNALLPNKNVPAHNRRYMDAARVFAVANGLNVERTWQAWTMGPAKLFLNDLEHHFNAAMISELREQGFAGLIATTNFWGGMSMAGLPSLTDGDIIDVHVYGDPGEIRRDPKAEADMFSRIASAQVAGMPLSVSEWNVTPFPAEDRFVVPLRLAALARLQGWDALVAYGYAQQSLSAPMRPGPWDMAVDPAMLAAMPAAALLFRAGHVAAATRRYRLEPSADDLFETPLKAETLPALRTLTETSAVSVGLPGVPELPWMRSLKAENAEIVTDMMQAFGEPDGLVTSDTGEFGRDPAAGLFWIDTSRTRAVAGYLPAAGFAGAGLEFQSGSNPVMLAVQSLDDRPLEQAGEILISLVSPAVPASERTLPFLSEPLQGVLRFHAPPGLRLSGLESVSHRVEGDLHILEFSGVTGAVLMRLSAAN